MYHDEILQKGVTECIPFFKKKDKSLTERIKITNRVFSTIFDWKCLWFAHALMSQNTNGKKDKHIILTQSPEY